MNKLMMLLKTNSLELLQNSKEIAVTEATRTLLQSINSNDR